MFKQRFLNLISNDFGIDGSDFLATSLPVHINDSTTRLIKSVGDTVYRKALAQRPQEASGVVKFDSFSVDVTIEDTSDYEVGDYVILEGNENYNSIQYIIAVNSGTSLRISSPYNAEWQGLILRTQLRHDIELAGAYFTAYDILPTLMQVSENTSIVEGGSIGQGSWHLGDINKRKYYLNRALEIVSSLTETEDPNSLKFDLI